MDSEIAGLEGVFRLRAWAEKNKQRLIWGTAIVVVAGLGLYFYVSRRAMAEQTAAEELSKLHATQSPTGTPVPVSGETYLKFAAEHSGTQAAARAELFAAGAFFNERKYPEARTQFERFLRDYPESPLRTQALYGNAACLEAQDKTSEAAAAYKSIADRYPGDPTVPRAKLALARAYEAEKQTEQALRLYEELARNESFSTVGLIAEGRMEDLKLANPALGARPTTGPLIVAPTSLRSNRAPTAITNSLPPNTNH